MANLENTDLMLVNRSDQTYKITGEDLKNTISNDVVGDGAINVDAGDGLTASGSNATANQSGDTTRTLSADKAWFDNLYAEKEVAAFDLLGTIEADNADSVEITGFDSYDYQNFVIKITTLRGFPPNGIWGTGSPNQGQTVPGSAIPFQYYLDWNINGAWSGHCFAAQTDVHSIYSYEGDTDLRKTTAVSQARMVVGPEPPFSEDPDSNQVNWQREYQGAQYWRFGTTNYNLQREVIDSTITLHNPALDSNLHSFSWINTQSGWSGYVPSTINANTFDIVLAEGSGSVLNDLGKLGYDSTGPAVTGLRLRAFTDGGGVGGQGALVPVSGTFKLYGVK